MKREELRVRKKKIQRFLLLILNSSLLTFFLAGCAALGFKKLEVPPDFNQKVILEVSDNPQMFQAPRSQYDAGDLQAFHTQQTLPTVIEDAFREMFGEVEVREEGAQIETSVPDVPAIFEVRILDLANDIYNEATSYRAEVTLAVAMKSPRGKVFWQQAFRGQGYAISDPQFSMKLGPQDAVLDAMRDAIDQMQRAIVASPQVRAQMKYYKDIDAARQKQEVKV